MQGCFFMIFNNNLRNKHSELLIVSSVQSSIKQESDSVKPFIQKNNFFKRIIDFFAKPNIEMQKNLAAKKIQVAFLKYRLRKKIQNIDPAQVLA